MKLNEQWTRKGYIRVAIIRNNKIAEIVEMPNLIVDTGLNFLRDALDGTISDAEIKYMAWGGSNQAVDPGDTTLVSEFGRKAVTSKTPGATGILVTLTYMSSFEGNTPKIEELGWFAGAGATSDPDTGVMIARVLYSHQKTTLETIVVSRTDTVS